MALPTSPPELSNTSVSVIGCLFTFTLYVVVLSIPAFLLVGTFIRFLVVKRNVMGEHVNLEFVDELTSATVYSVFIALLIFLVFKFSEWWGVPISKIIKDAFEVKTLFPEYSLNACREPMASPIKFFLSVFSASLRLAITFIPIVGFVYIFIRRLNVAKEIIQRGQEEPIAEYLKVAIYGAVLFLGVLVLISVSLKIIGVDYRSVVNSTLGAILEYVRGG